MNWSLTGWILIGLSAVLLGTFSIIYKYKKGYLTREEPSVNRLYSARTAAFEKGQQVHLGLGQRMWSGLYPGLGLHGLSNLTAFLDREAINSGRLGISSGDGVLVLFARQIIKNQYGNGYAFLLDQQRVIPYLPGPTPATSTAGLLLILGMEKHGATALVGNYSAESVLFSESIQSKDGYFFSATGNLTSQAVLFPSTRDLLIGENVFLLPGLFSQDSGLQAGWITEDIIRIAVIFVLIVAAILKMVGVL